jgi:hypothetical protein
MNQNILNFISKRVEFMKLLGMTDRETSDEKYMEVVTKLFEEQEEKTKISDSLICYNDEIVEIEYIGERETIDISVTGDSLFYCNGVLTKNSIGLAATCDVICSLWQDEESRELGVINMGMQKNRFGPNFGSAAFKCNYNTLTLKETNSDYFESDANSTEDSIKNADRALNSLLDNE